MSLSKLQMKLTICFVSVGPSSENEVTKVSNVVPEKFLENRIQFNFIIAYISNEEVLEFINSLN